MAAILQFSATARTSRVDDLRDITTCQEHQKATVATLSSTLRALEAALAVVAAQIAVLPNGQVRMELTVQHLHLNIAAFRAKQAIAEIDLE